MEVNRQLRSTLYDLIADLEKSEVTAHYAKEIRAALKEVKTTKLHRAIRDLESPLSKSIPMDLLRSDPNGSAYADIIEEFRPKKKPESEYNALTSLAESIKNELGDDVPESLEQLTPEVFQNVVQKTMAIMESKQASGEFDMASIQAQAQKMMSQFKDNPELQAAFGAISSMKM